MQRSFVSLKFMRMKKMVTVFFLVMATMVNAQESPYQMGDNVLTIGLGFGSSFGYNSARQTPAVSIQFEHATWALGSGIVSMGGYLGYKGYSYKANLSNNYTYSQKWNYYILGVRGAWHLTTLNNVNLTKWDLYGGLMLSYNYINYSSTANDPIYDYSRPSSYNSGLGFSTFLGARYFVTNKIALMGELGYGISFLNLGVSFKL
jgi:hypothetical protein